MFFTRAVALKSFEPKKSVILDMEGIPKGGKVRDSTKMLGFTVANTVSIYIVPRECLNRKF